MHQMEALRILLSAIRSTVRPVMEEDEDKKILQDQWSQVDALIDEMNAGPAQETPIDAIISKVKEKLSVLYPDAQLDESDVSVPDGIVVFTNGNDFLTIEILN